MTFVIDRCDTFGCIVKNTEDFQRRSNSSSGGIILSMRDDRFEEFHCDFAFTQLRT